MRVTLVNPPNTTDIETVSAIGLKAPPLGLAYIGAVLEKEAVDVTIIDAAVNEMSHKRLGEMLQKSNPDVVGVTSTTLTICDALKVVIISKECAPKQRQCGVDVTSLSCPWERWPSAPSWM